MMMDEEELALLSYQLRERAQLFKHHGMVNSAYIAEQFCNEAERFLDAKTEEERARADKMARRYASLMPRAIVDDE
jgi:hypothetical protein